MKLVVASVLLVTGLNGSTVNLPGPLKRTVVCADGVTECDSWTTSCRNCYCYVVPQTQIVYGVHVLGSNGACIWSNCECVGL